MANIGKRMKKAVASFDRSKLYSLQDAAKIVIDNAKAKFVETFEVAINLGIDPTQSDQLVRGVVNMPHGTGKSVRVAVFAKGDKADDARAAGAELVGAEDLAERINAGEMGFDRCIATPDMMGVVGKLGKVLGPRGLMPNPKLGTVTPNIKEAVKAAKAGSVEFRTDKAGIIHAGIGKVNFPADHLVANLKEFLAAIVRAKPAVVKGNYVKNVTVSSTMGPGVKIDISGLTGIAG